MCNNVLTSFQSHGSRDQPSAQELTKYMGQPFPAPRQRFLPENWVGASFELQLLPSASPAHRVLGDFSERLKGEAYVLLDLPYCPASIIFLCPKKLHLCPQKCTHPNFFTVCPDPPILYPDPPNRCPALHVSNLARPLAAPWISGSSNALVQTDVLFTTAVTLLPRERNRWQIIT